MSKKRRQHTAQFKFETVMDGFRGDQTIAQICRDGDITESLYYKWRDAFLEQAPSIFVDQRQHQQAEDEKDAQIADLERLAGKLALENEILKKAKHWFSRTQQEKRELIGAMKTDYPVQQLCEIIDCPPSTYYYQLQVPDESGLMAAIEAILMRWPFYGYRRVLKELHRRGWDIVGERVVRRLLKQMDVSRQVGRVTIPTTDSSQPHWRYPNRIKGWKATYPDQVWVADITYIRLGRRFFYLAVILVA